MEYTNSMEYTNLSSQIVFLKDADIVNDMSANTISSNHVLSNGIPSYDLFRKHYDLVSTDISNISDDIEYLLSVDKKAMVYNATLLSTDTITNSRLTTFLDDNFHNPNYKFKQGWMYHLSVGQVLSDANNNYDYIGENDYFIVNKTTILSNITFNDIDLVRDSLNEIIELCNSLSITTTNICVDLQQQIISNDNDISALCSEVSTKIWIKNPDSEAYKNGKYSDLSIVKINIADYNAKVYNDLLQDNTIYVVSADYIEVYGQVISNLTMTDDSNISEAATLHYVDALRTDVILSIKNLCSEISANDSDISSISSDLLSIDTRYVNTFTTKDKELWDGHVSSDNLIITDPFTHIAGAEHKKYYMSFESGTLVLKPLN